MSGYIKMLPVQKPRKNSCAMTSSVGSPNSGKSQTDDCPCKRPRARVLCSACGFITEGRVRYPCGKHGNVIFINDYSQCPMCKVYDFMLIEF